MQVKALALSLFIALATALPAGEDNVADVIQGTEKNPQWKGSDADNTVLAQKNWQAAGGCKTDWDENRRCLTQCMGEANSKCRGWKSMTAVIQGGCVWGWNTCRCVCEY
ncbi:uncharacterized protein CTRU02_204867 [Colletotrichum truncatum]|uniref:Uncharacterized protein n=1 Tax=Colletotrichum truncatum TaxID=5467 RepID=A0ACC3ZD96_COLTU|nr:uncharacterized protein CTRU02_03101 [Colletotrichum truncatum]KAF6798059.1 hypothetical protein CTRU02_03101 [Colletotrichum truncatum]